MKAIIKTVRSGNRKGEFRFILKAKNGEVIATSGTETYTQKHNCISILEKHFSNFKIVDESIPRLIYKKK